MSDLIDEIQAENQELTLVRDGSEAVRLVTATDTFETITGERADPLDRRPAGGPTFRRSDTPAVGRSDSPADEGKTPNTDGSFYP